MAGPPLEGIKVVDVGSMLAGPIAAKLLGQMGADVIHVEPPWGDDGRNTTTPFLGREGFFYLTFNQGVAGSNPARLTRFERPLPTPLQMRFTNEGCGTGRYPVRFVQFFHAFWITAPMMAVPTGPAIAPSIAPHTAAASVASAPPSF